MPLTPKDRLQKVVDKTKVTLNTHETVKKKEPPATGPVRQQPSKKSS